MPRYKTLGTCAVIFVAGAITCSLRSQTAGTQPPPPAQAQSDNGASTHDPNLTPLETVQYINNALSQVRLPEGIETGSTTNWPGYFAIEQSKGILWWVRGIRTGESEWEIRFSSARVDQLDLNALALGLGDGNYEVINIPCKPTSDRSALDNCWQNWVGSWDDQSSSLKQGHFGSIKFARAADNESQQILDASDFSVSPLKKQILLLNGNQRQLIDVGPAKPTWGLEAYLGAANSDMAQRIFRALKYLVKKMPPAATESDPFGP
jgi:hypothetical protein